MVGVIKQATKKYLLDRGVPDIMATTLSRDRRVSSSNVQNKPYIINITKHPPSEGDPRKHTLDAVLRKIENKDNFINHLPWLKDEDYYGVPNIGAVFYQTKPSKEALRPYIGANVNPPSHMGVGISNLGFNQILEILYHETWTDPEAEDEWIKEFWLSFDERRTEWKPEWDDYQYEWRGNARFINWPLDPPRIE
ncbi:hypothetical protein CL614_02500 [archaeon]|nr:hypothetical protein [archaeon]|tara:strand:+ start:579 stop:1160 length:582 start_codon:yes stop_codon:yes gene_type:complete